MNMGKGLPKSKVFLACPAAFVSEEGREMARYQTQSTLPIVCQVLRSWI